MATIDIETEDKLEYVFHPVTSGSLHFKIRAPNDGHVALTQGPVESDPMYEVFLGGWGNTKSVIRRNRTKPDVAEVETPDILNGDEFRGFWIRWNGGHITVGKEGDAEPFLDYNDPEPFGIGYYGVCTGWGASGTWKIEGDDEISTSDLLEYKFAPIAGGAIEFHIRAPHNCHVALTSDKVETDPMYEIILGGWENTASVIRYRREKPDKVRKDTVRLLNVNELRRFIVEWYKGNIIVRTGTGNTVDTCPILLEWTDPNPIGISHFGVRTAWGAKGQWKLKTIDPRRPGRREQPAAANLVAGSTGSQCWVPATSGQVPPNAVEGGQDNGEPLYVARAQHEGGLIPGKLVSSHGCAYVAWGGAEHAKDQYEVLCDCPSTWAPTSGTDIPARAIPGGETEDGEPLYIGRVEHNGALTTGKVQPSHGVVYIPYGGEEMGFPDYEVLVEL